MEINSAHLPYGKHLIDEDDLDAVLNVLRGSALTQGPKVKEFEDELANFISSDYVVALNSATSGLHLTCLALGIGPGDILWTTPNTFVASANCALYCGAKVDFVDINLRTGLISIEKLEEKLKIAEERCCLPKAIVVVHYAGTSCDMESISRLSKQYQFFVVEDASHAIGGSYNGSPVGACKFSDATVFSFHPVKIITCGEGGAVATKSFSLAKKIRLLRSHGITKISEDFEDSSPGDWRYEQQYLGFNYRMNDIEAALGLSQIKKLKRYVDCRNKIYQNYLSLLNEHDQLQMLEIPQKVYSALHLSVVRISDCDSRRYNHIFNFMRSNNIGVQLHYIPVHTQPFYLRLGFRLGQFPASEEFSHSSLSLPIYPGLSLEDQERVIITLKKSLTLF